MTLRQFEQAYRFERRVISLAFVLMVMIMVGFSAVQHSAELFAYAAYAYDNPTEVYQTFVRGVANYSSASRPQ